MSESPNFKAVARALAAQAGTDASRIAAKDHLNSDLGLDSLDLWEVFIELEDALAVDLNDEGLSACVLVADLVALVDKGVSRD